MKRRTFLGKPIPSQAPSPGARQQKNSLSWVLWVAAPVVLIGASAWLVSGVPAPATPNTAQEVSSEAVGVAVQSSRTFAQAPAGGTGTTSGTSSGTGTGTGTGTELPSGPSEVASPTCDLGNADIAAEFNSQKIFPILPKVILDPYTVPGCSPPFWNLGIMVVLVWKVVGLLNWIAGVLAVILTVYAGLLYIGGFANESYVGTAKKILMAAYSGLAIVVFARLILYAPVQFLSAAGTTTNDSFKSSTQQVLVTGTSTSTATGTATGTTSGGTTP
jgi:hypothetical protein